MTRIDGLDSENDPMVAEFYELHGLVAIGVSQEYMAKHDPQPGGYYVRYADGYESFSPAKAFEGGYATIPTDVLSLTARAAGTDADPMVISRCVDEELFSLRAGGRFYVRGELTTDDAEIVRGLRAALCAGG